MCKYCGDDERKIIIKPVDLGVMGKHEIDACISESELWVEFLRADEGEAIFSKTLKITYCPFCGRRLKKEPKKQS